jgi:hypothetical protein
MAEDKKKALTKAQAQKCEDASEPVCKCRCGGAEHGRGGGEGLEYFQGLPPDDPHHLPTDEEKKAAIKARLEEKRRLKAEADKRKWDYIDKHNQEMAEMYKNNPDLRW